MSSKSAARNRRLAVTVAVVVGIVVVGTFTLLLRQPVPPEEEPTPLPSRSQTPPPLVRPSPPAPTEEAGTVGGPALTWAPPDTTGYEHVVLREPGTLRLDDDTDYVIDSPDIIEGAVSLRGGRNIVWIGGHIRIPSQGEYPDTASRRGLVISDGDEPTDGRTVHIEGLRIDGEDLSEGVNTNAPSAIVQLQNLRIGPVSFRESSDRDGREAYPSVNHPDIIQTWGSVGELRIDGLTGSSAYQGIFLKADKNRPHGPTLLRRVDLEAVKQVGENGETFYGQRLLWWDPRFSGSVYVDNGTVYLDHHPGSEWGPRFGDNVHPPITASGGLGADVVRDDDGRYLYWPGASSPESDDIAVLDFSGEAEGRIYAGSPPTGDYVTEEQAGIRYEAPGYRATHSLPR